MKKGIIKTFAQVSQPFPVLPSQKIRHKKVSTKDLGVVSFFDKETFTFLTNIFYSSQFYC